MGVPAVVGRALAATCLILAMTGASAAAQEPGEAPPRKVTVGILYLIADAGIFIAKERGYFTQQGLDVEMTRFTSAADMVALLATNKIDIGSGSASPGLFNAFRQGIDVKIVSGKSNMIAPDFGSGAFLIRADLVEDGQVKSLADLKGRKVAVNNINSTSLNYVVRGLSAGGLTRNDVTLVELPFAQFIPALQNKAVDSAMAYAPLSDTIADKLKLARAFPEGGTARTSDGDVTNMMFYSPGFAKTDAAKRFMVAHVNGLRDYYRTIVQRQGSRTEICRILNLHLNNVPPDCAGITMSGVEPDGLVNVESLERYQREWIAWGVMREPADIRKYVDTRFLEYAWSKLGKF